MVQKDYSGVIKLLNEQSNFVRSDSNTFIWAKSQKNFSDEHGRNNNSIFSMGGGNLSIALASLSFYGLLAKIYRIITTNKSRNEAHAVYELTRKVNSTYNIFENERDIGVFWKLVRNGLVHCFLPKASGAVVWSIHAGDLESENSYRRYINDLQNSSSFSISKNESRFVINADLLAVKIVKVSDWLIDELRHAEYSEDRHRHIQLLYS